MRYWIWRIIEDLDYVFTICLVIAAGFALVITITDVLQALT